MNKNEIFEQIKNDKTMIYGQSMLDVFLQTTEDLKIDHYLELDDKQKKLINNAILSYNLAITLGADGRSAGYLQTTSHDTFIRRPELEKNIMKDPECAYLYAGNIIKGRWKEAEPYIMKKPEYAYYYAANVIKKRWPEAEETIKNSHYWNRYKKRFEL
jgi:hypothetical protein